jgi:glutamate carboxypeptidase
MKAGARLAFEAFLSFLRVGTPTPLPITYLFNSGEEVGSPTSREVIRSLGARAKFVLVTEPARNGGRIVTARKGAARFDLHVKGRAAHSGSRHEDGRSAIGELAHQIIALHAMTDYARGVTVNVGTIAGGTRPNVVAEEARAAIDMRLPTLTIAEELLAHVFALKSHDPDVTLTITGGLNRPPYEKTPSIAALFDHARALATEIGFDLQDLKTGGGSDGNFCADLAPVLDGLGADGKGGHTDHEQIYLDSLVPRALLLQRLMETLS